MARMKLDFKNLWKAFIASEPTDDVLEDAIKNSNEIDEEQRKELLASLKGVEKMEKERTGIPVFKATRIKVDSKKAVEKALKEKASKEKEEKDDSREM